MHSTQPRTSVSKYIQATNHADKIDARHCEVMPYIVQSRRRLCLSVHEATKNSGHASQQPWMCCKIGRVCMMLACRQMHTANCTKMLTVRQLQRQVPSLQLADQPAAALPAPDSMHLQSHGPSQNCIPTTPATEAAHQN